MIARTWRGATVEAASGRYLKYLRNTGLRAYAQTRGNLGVLGLRRMRDGKAEFLLVSLWESPQAISGFAGADPSRAVFYPEDEDFLVERDELVEHFEVVHAQLPGRRGVVRRLLDWWRTSWREDYHRTPPGGWKAAAFR